MDGTDVVALAGRRIRVVPLSLACCGVELASGLRLVAQDAVARAAATAEVGSADAEPVDLHVLVVAGTVTPGFLPAITAEWDELPDPKVAIGFGVCTLSGGPYWDSYAVIPGMATAPELPSNLTPFVRVPGCPPQPAALRAALLLALEGAPA